MIWFWIGPHDQYERLLKQIKEPNALYEVQAPHSEPDNRTPIK